MTTFGAMGPKGLIGANAHMIAIVKFTMAMATLCTLQPEDGGVCMLVRIECRIWTWWNMYSYIYSTATTRM